MPMACAYAPFTSENRRGLTRPSETPRQPAAGATPAYSGWCAENPPPQFTGGAVDAYGADDVTAAYRAMAESTMNMVTWNPTFVRIPVDQLTPADYDFLAPYMTAAGRAKLRDLAQRSMAEAERTDGSASEYLPHLPVLAFGALGGSTSSSVLTWPKDDADLVTDKKLTDPSTKVDFAPDGAAGCRSPSPSLELCACRSTVCPTARLRTRRSPTSSLRGRSRAPGSSMTSMVNGTAAAWPSRRADLVSPRWDDSALTAPRGRGAAARG
jgi:hypothetical protein